MMDEDYFLTPKIGVTFSIPKVECRKHGTTDQFIQMGHRRFCVTCIGDYLEKAIGQAVVK